MAPNKENTNERGEDHETDVETLPSIGDTSNPIIITSSADIDSDCDTSITVSNNVYVNRQSLDENRIKQEKPEEISDMRNENICSEPQHGGSSQLQNDHRNLEPIVNRNKRKCKNHELETVNNPASRDISEVSINTVLPAVPRVTLAWTTDVLNSLPISIHQSTDFDPFDLISDVIGTDSVLDEVTESLKAHIVQYMPEGLKNLDFTCVEEITTDYKGKFTSNDGSNSCWKFQNLQGVNQLFQQFYSDKYGMNTRYLNSLFGSVGEVFGRYLMFLASIQEQQQIVTESMYRDLFQRFLQMFGLYCYTKPSAPNRTMRVKGVDVETRTDLLLLREKTLKTVAVCQVKVTSRTSALLEYRNVGSVKRLKTGSLSDKIIGHSVGDLLLHSRSSISTTGVIGMIVQNTYVTFTHLKLPEKDAIDVINSGKYFDKNSKIVIKYSKPYNYLKSEDRLDLIKPLLMLRFLSIGDRES